jgi:hypothetical protein
MTADHDLPAIASRFAITGTIGEIAPLPGGHIHDSCCLTCLDGAVTSRYLLQRVNTNIFPEPLLVMENIRRVTAHLRRRLLCRRLPDIERRVLTLIPTRQGESALRDESGSFWRLYAFIEHAVTHETVPSPRHAYEAGRAFGFFQEMLSDWSDAPLHSTIPNFHDTPLRLDAMMQAVAADACGRVAVARPEIDRLVQHRSLAAILEDLARSGEIPERIVHNDAKISNVLFDAATEEALCVVDLDTVMPGLSLHDFGDLVRSMTSPTAEDEQDLSKVGVQLDLFEALTRGYLSAAGPFLSDTERRHLVAAAKVITWEQAVRFLTDFLRGDPYYKTSRPMHNLDRCRTQLRLVESLIECEPRLRRIAEQA